MPVSAVPGMHLWDVAYAHLEQPGYECGGCGASSTEYPTARISVTITEVEPGKCHCQPVGGGSSAQNCVQKFGGWVSGTFAGTLYFGEKLCIWDELGNLKATINGPSGIGGSVSFSKTVTMHMSCGQYKHRTAQITTGGNCYVGAPVGDPAKLTGQCAVCYGDCPGI